MSPQESALREHVLWQAREQAFPPGEFVGQESLVDAGQVLALAGIAGVAPGVRVLDLCCGVAGPGLLVTRALGGTYLGVDASARSAAVARHRFATAGVSGRVEVGRVPPVPPGPFDVVLLLETMLAFPDKRALLREVASALAPGGRLALTLEEGLPLTAAERQRMPRADTVWLAPLPDVVSHLEGAGLRVRWRADWSSPHALTALALADAYASAARGPDVGPARDLLDELVRSHRLWGEWLLGGRVRKLALVAERPGP